MRKRTLISLILTVVMIFTASGIVSAATWEYYFPITVSDNTGATRTMYPVVLEVGGDSLVDGGYLTANGTDARLRTTTDQNLLMSTTNITFVVDSLPAYGQVTYDLYTGYSPEISAFPVIVGDGGYVTVADNTTIELGGNFTVEQSGWWDTDAGANKLATQKPVAFRTFVSPVVSENITSQVLGTASTNALDFELANSDFVSVPDDPAFTFNTAGDDDPFSIATYIRLESVGALGTVLSKWTGAGDKIEWLFAVGADGKLDARLSDPDSSNTLIVTGDTVLSTATWYHIAMTYSGNETWTGIKLYVDGVEESTTDGSGGTYVGMSDNTSTVNIGSTDAGGNNYFDGIIFGLRIYDVELTAAEVVADAWLDHKATDLVALWLLTDGAGNPADTSGNGHNATSNAADWVTADTPSLIEVTATGVASGEHIATTTCEGALDFVRANSDWVSIPDHADFSFTDGAGNDEPFSIVCWVNLDDATTNRFVSKALTNNNEWTLATTGTDLVYFMLFNPTATIYIARTTAAVTGYEGDWIHIVATYDGTEVVGGIDIYINGVVADDADLAGGAYAGMSGGGAVVELGSTNGGTAEYLDGLLDNVKIYDVELTPAEALADYNGGLKFSDLVAWYQLEEGTGNPQDTSGNGHNATANTADWVSVLRIYIDDTLEDEDISATYSVPDNPYDWTFYNNNVLPYADNTTISVNGIQQLWFEPNEMITSTTLPDRATLTANDGTITWGVNDGVEIVFGSVASYEATISAASVNETGFVLPLVGIPDNWWGMEFEGEDLPFYPTFLDTSTETGIPLQTLYLLVVFGAAIALATVTIVLTRSVVVGVAFYTITMSYGANAGIVAWWIIYVFLIMVLGIIFLSSRQAMGG